MVDVTPDMVKVSVHNGRTLVGGRVMRTPTNVRPPKAAANSGTGLPDMRFGSQEHLADYPSTRAADKALLIALGVNGEVPLRRARINAGLPADGSRPAVLVRGRWVAANDNHELAAEAA